MKTIFNKPLLYGALVALLAASCTGDDDKATSNDSRVPARISAGVQTRAVNDVWNENDVIGISMIDPKDGTVLAPYANYDYTTVGDGNFSPVHPDKIIYLPADGKEVSFKAYYPFSADTPAGQALPVSVGSQTALADIDLMTAEHVSGTSIDDPNVKLHFYHRLAKVLIDLTTDETGLIDLKDSKLTIKGLKTKATYDLMKEVLSTDDASTADINVPLHNAKGEAIWLPRAAGEGVTFEVTTADGGTYTAQMDAALELKAGYKHTFHIRLKSTPVTVSATIEEWVEGPERKTDVIRLVTGLKDSENFQKDDTLRLFLKDKDQADFGYLSTFKYSAEGKWSTPVPTYWESITADPASFRGATVIAPKLNNTQMDDILVSKDTETAQYTGVNLEMQHAGSKAIVELKSTDGTFSANDLKNATVILPDYLTGGSIDLQTGAFVPGTGRTDIKPEGGIAIFPPQVLANGKLIAQITLNGRTYDVKVTEPDGFEYKAGVANKLTMDLHKSEVEMSATVTPWTEETHEFQDVRIATAALGSNGGDLQNGDILYIYTGNSESRTPKGEHFIYNSTADNWTYSNSSNPLYWEDIAITDGIYGFIERPALSNTPGTNQLPDYIVTPTPVANGGGATNTALNLQMEHAVAKVIVILKSNTFSLGELADSKVTLPDYMTGGTMNNGLFVPGTTTADIQLDKLATDAGHAYLSDAAYLQPQDIEAGKTVVKVVLGGRTYEAKKDNEVIKYEAGKITTLIINLEKSGIQVSTKVANWDTKDPVGLTGMFFEIGGGEVKDFNVNDKIAFYKINNNKTAGNTTGTVQTADSKTIISLSPMWYRNDFTKGDKILAVFPNQTPVLADNAAYFDFTSTGTDEAKNDLLTTVSSIGDDTNIKFDFSHALSKVKVNIIAGEGFSKEELTGVNVALNNFKLTGTVSVTGGKATAKGDASNSITPTAATLTSGSTFAASFSALVMPQTIERSTKIVTVTLNGKEYTATVADAYPQESQKMVLEENKEHVINITLKKTGLSLSATVAAWTDGNGGDITIQ